MSLKRADAGRRPKKSGVCRRIISPSVNGGCSIKVPAIELRCASLANRRVQPAPHHYVESAFAIGCLHPSEAAWLPPTLEFCTPDGWFFRPCQQVA